MIGCRRVVLTVDKEQPVAVKETMLFETGRPAKKSAVSPDCQL